MAKCKVLIIGGNRLEQSLWCIYRGFERLGCAVEHIIGRLPDGEPKLPQVGRVLNEIERGVDLIYWWQPQSCGLKAAVPPICDEAHAAGTPIVMQCLDDPYMVDRCQPTWVRWFDLVVTCCEGSILWYREHGTRAILGYPPCDPELHGEAKPDPALACDFSFAATNVYPRVHYKHVFLERVAMVGAAARVGSVHVYGHWDEKTYGWGGKYGLGEDKRGLYQGWRDYVDMPAAYASAAINLNSHIRPDGYKYLNERVITCMASGGFMLCDRVAGITEIFEDGVHLALYGPDMGEFLSQCEWWLKEENAPARRAAAQSSRLRALNEFNNERLARRILDECGVKR